MLAATPGCHLSSYLSPLPQQAFIAYLLCVGYTMFSSGNAAGNRAGRGGACSFVYLLIVFLSYWNVSVISRVCGFSYLPRYPQPLEQHLARRRNSRSDCCICKSLHEDPLVICICNECWVWPRTGFSRAAYSTPTYSGSGGQERGSWGRNI